MENGDRVQFPGVSEVQKFQILSLLIREGFFVFHSEY